MKHDNELMLPLNVKPSFDNFLSILSITNKGLAAQLIEPVYKQFFVYSKDIKREYVKYYSIEYPTLSEYIEIYHNVKLSEENLGKKYIFKYRNNCLLTDPAYDRDYLERIVKLLKKMEESDES